jgi:hypothetical protein
MTELHCRQLWVKHVYDHSGPPEMTRISGYWCPICTNYTRIPRKRTLYLSGFRHTKLVFSSNNELHITMLWGGFIVDSYELNTSTTTQTRPRWPKFQAIGAPYVSTARAYCESVHCVRLVSATRNLYLFHNIMLFILPCNDGASLSTVMS